MTNLNGRRKIAACALTALMALTGSACSNKQAEPGAAPSATLVGPPDGAGPTVTFSAKYEDPAGGQSIVAADIIVNETLSPSHACYVHYDGQTHLITLMEDAKATWMPGAPMGAPGGVQNSQCAVDSAKSSYTVDGNALLLKAAIAFKPEFAGTKKVFLYAADKSGTNTGFPPVGQWRVTKGE